ncbi:MAG TPA: PCRF domain-containing protein, partial [Burkholderiales bacterium]|nr:PCRF domain-containing protein [Burkholderiales bacterium]
MFDLEGKQQRLSVVEELLAKPDVWSDQKRAQELGREKKALDSTVSALVGIASELEDARELFDMARPQNDDAILTALVSDVAQYEKNIAAMEFRRMFSNPLDPNNCFMDIQAGAGGTEAQDWASMLERMYLKYCDKKGFRAEVL